MRHKLGFDATSIHTDFATVLGNQAPSYRTVARWVSKFKDGLEDLEDEPRPGRPITAQTNINIEKVREVIEINPWSTFDEIEAETLLSRGTIQTIMHDVLKLKKLTSRWVPHLLTEKNRQDRVSICQENLRKFKSKAWRLCDVLTGDESWFYWRQLGRKQSNASWVAEGQSPRTVVRREQFESKTMVCIFFRTRGAELITWFERGKNVDSNAYIDYCLKPLVNSIKKQRTELGTSKLKFHHDNARPHTAKIVTEYLNEQNFTIIDHPPYSPDLAPSDFWLFDYIKQRLDDHTSAESLVNQITRILESIPREEYQKTFNKWIERMELCLLNNGDYFEHLIKEN